MNQACRRLALAHPVSRDPAASAEPPPGRRALCVSHLPCGRGLGLRLCAASDQTALRSHRSACSRPGSRRRCVPCSAQRMPPATLHPSHAQVGVAAALHFPGASQMACAAVSVRIQLLLDGPSSKPAYGVGRPCQLSRYCAGAARAVNCSPHLHLSEVACEAD